MRLVQRFFPVYPKISGHNFFVRQEGKLFCTPLFICLVVIEFADIMFAFDSVPAIIAITREPFLVYTSNIFAILGLRSMYFLLAGAKRYLCHLEKAVIAILFFIGIKMLLDVAGIIHITPTVSLMVGGRSLEWRHHLVDRIARRKVRSLKKFVFRSAQGVAAGCFSATSCPPQ